MNHLLKFKAKPWEILPQGVQQKSFAEGELKIRLLRFSDQFTEPD